jgi:hypothetical protein
MQPRPWNSKTTRTWYALYKKKNLSCFEMRKMAFLIHCDVRHYRGGGDTECSNKDKSEPAE